MASINDEFYKIDLLHKADFVPAPNGDFSLAKGIINVKQRLFHRLITVPNSLVHRPLFGVGVQRWQNDIATIARQRDLASLIKEQFEQDEAVEKLESIQIVNTKENGTFELRYKVKIIGFGLVDETVSPFGDLTI